ncbi:IS481 family transposase [Spirosoma foliorum]|uniref:IS481 family transposase n=1 Tax=Spirosoma foliorum TaxID=2710596 RepID=A0A7G5GWS1_9BACT|nr:IS481 family transposase [Spirosoma foliorum]QMW03313.1 IS481 family transposase [Spirosoma foliorum]
MAPDSASAQTRQKWLAVYYQVGSISVAARRCGIARSTLQRWIKRKELEGFEDRSRRPHHLARQQFDDEVENLVLQIRQTQNIGKIRICSFLFQQHSIQVSVATVGRILKKNDCPPIKRFHKQQPFIRYSRPIPSDRVQMDVCKITTGIYQYTAIDDCSRFRVMYTYKRRTAANTIDFLDRLIEQMPFPIQRIQTDRGREFFAYCFQERLMEYHIKFRPIKPRSPHLNGKVERSQQTDLQEFYRTADLKDAHLNDRLEEWQFYYNYQRSHSSLNGKTPGLAVAEIGAETPFWDDVIARYDPSKERIREQHYARDKQVASHRRKSKT